MQSKHDKLFVSNPIYMEKVNKIISRALMKIRLDVISEIDLDLKNNNTLSSASFLWIGLIEYFGDYEKIEIELKKIDRKYGDLEVNIFIPMRDLKGLDINNIDIVTSFYKGIYKYVLDEIKVKYNL